MKYESMILLFLSANVCVNAQEMEVNSGYDSMSIKKIHESDVMWSKGITRRLDLRELPNQPLFAKGREFSKLLIEATQDSLIIPYKSSTLDETMTIAEFMKLMELPDYTPGDVETDPSWCCELGDPNDPESEQLFETEYYFPKDIYLVEMEEDLVFDKQRSRMYTDIKSITIFLSADHPDNIRGIDIPLATFSYKDIHDNLFKDNPDASWTNPYNDSANLNLADAFELRLFHSHIIKVSNPNDDYLIDIYGGDPKQARIASQMKAYELLEFESNLWEN